MSVRDFALQTAHAIGPVFPCKRRSKEPAGWLVPNGCKDASRDPETICRWFDRRSTLNLALAFEPGMFALDIDPRNDGYRELERLQRLHGPLPLITVRNQTGGCGEHFLLRHDPAIRLKNGAIAPGVEIKANGGYIVIPPSVHPNGTRYEWNPYTLPSETAIAEAPIWLVNLARDRAAPRDDRDPVGPVANSFFGVAFARAGWLGAEFGRNGKRAARCPWAAEHSDGRGFGDDSSTALLPPTSDARLGAWHCTHAHCSSRTLAELIAALPAEAIAEALEKFPSAASALRRLATRDAHRRSF